MGREIVPNGRLKAARKALMSPSGSGRPMSRQELADACNVELSRLHSELGDGQRWAGLTEKTIGALERGEIRWPNDEYRRALCTVLRADERALGLYIDRPNRTERPQARDSMDAGFRAGPSEAEGSDVHGPGETLGSSFGEQDLEWAIDQSADQALVFASAAATGLDAMSTDDLFSRVADLAQGYASQDRWRTFNRARYLRDVAFEQATRTKRPDNLTDLYLLSALNALLMSSAAFDLGHPSGALRLAQAARTLAGLSGHSEAETWSVGLIATLFNWQDRPTEALVEIRRANRLTTSAKELFRLKHIQARSFALVGYRDEAHGALCEAEDFLAGVNSSSLLHDQIAGEFAFDSARASACAGAAWIHLGDGAAARHHLEMAIDQYQALPEQQRPWAPLTGAQVDLAAACVMSRDLDAAEAAIEPLFVLDGGRRISTITGRVASARRQLRGYENDRHARQLESRIAEWSMEMEGRSISYR